MREYVKDLGVNELDAWQGEYNSWCPLLNMIYSVCLAVVKWYTFTDEDKPKQATNARLYKTEDYRGATEVMMTPENFQALNGGGGQNMAYVARTAALEMLKWASSNGIIPDDERKLHAVLKSDNRQFGGAELPSMHLMVHLR